MFGRVEGAVELIKREVVARAGFRTDPVDCDDDLVDDLGMGEIELESLQFALEDAFGINIPCHLWDSPLHRTSRSLGEWCVRQAELAAEIELRRQRRSA